MLSNKTKLTVISLVLLVYTIFISTYIKAEIVHCCQWTNDNKFCVESSDINFNDFKGCKAGYLSSYKSCTNNEVSQCKLGTCIPSSTGECLANKFKVECTQNNQGKWFDHDIRSVAECQVGCCNVGGSVCSLQEKKVCVQDLATGDNSAFNPAITNSLECDNSCRGADLGTCKTDNSCRYVTRKQCAGEFFTNKYPREVIGCFVKSHAYKSCGDSTSDNDKYNVYWFDGSNNREEIVEECSFPDEICSDIDSKGGDDAKCVSTKCVESCPDCYPNTFKSGESVCLNVLAGHFDNDKRSEGLSNYILHCQWGVVETDNVDFDRERRCYEAPSSDGTFNAKWKANNWQECNKCGEGGTIGSADYLGFAPIFGYPLVGALGNGCSENGRLGFDKCSEFGNGDCGSMFNDNAYDGDFIWPPLGSCNPKYPPGEGSRGYGDPVNRCDECGKGGDSATNLCTREECNSVGDCVFESKITGGLGATAGLAVGTCASTTAAAFILQHLPFVGQVAIGSAIAACKTPGPDYLFWGLVGTAYSIGGAEGSEISEYQLSQDVLVDGKTRLGPILALSRGIFSNAVGNQSTNLNQLEYLSRKENDRAGKFFGLSLLASGVAPPFAAGIAALSERFTKDQAGIALSRTFGTYKGMTSELKELNEFTKFKQTLKNAENLGNVISGVGLVSQFITTAKSFDTGICMPESDKTYTDNSRCNLCGAGEGQWYCTEERCNVLGGKRADDSTSSHCLWVSLNDTAKNDGLCLPKEPDDLTIPIITKINIQLFDNIGNKINEFSSNSKSFEVQSLLPWTVNTVKISIDTNERADCRYTSKIGASYDESLSFGDRAFPLSHNVEIDMTETEKIGGITYYFKCLDVNNNAINKADDSNFLRIKFDKRPDTSAPIIKSLDPKNVFLPERVNSIRISLLAYDENDVDSCKFSKDKTNFEDMEVTFDKAQSKSICTDTTVSDCREFTSTYSLINGQSVFIDGYDKNITIYPIFIKCKDNNGNVMIDPYNTSIFVIPTFNISINQPKENEKVWDRTPLINVTTGAIASCNYTIDNEGFPLSISSLDHVKEHTKDLSAGVHNLRVSCYDYASNEAVALRTFEVAYDDKPPFVSSIYKDDRKICIGLDEQADCKYSFEDIFPDGWEDANSMINNDKENCASLKEGEIYYIMCMDSWINNATFSIHP